MGRSHPRPRRLLQTSERVGSVDANPRSAHALVTRDSGGNETWQLELVRFGPGSGSVRAGRRSLTDDPAVMNLQGVWRDDGREYLYSSNARDPRFFDVYRRDVFSSDPPARVSVGDGWQMAVATRGEWSVLSKYTTFLDVDLSLVGTKGPPVPLNPHSDEVSVSSTAVGHDAVFVATNPGEEFLALWKYPLGGGLPEKILEYGADVELVRLSPDGRRLLVAVNRGGASELHVTDPDGERDRVVGPPDAGVLTSASWAPDGSGFAFDWNWPNGHEVFFQALGGRPPQPLTRSRHRPPISVGRPRLGATTAEDGRSIPYWDYRPRRATPRGVVFSIHGGPEGQWRPALDQHTAFLLGEGWRVIAPNVRGSTGYGRTYLHLDDVRRRMDSVRDLRDIARSVLGPSPRAAERTAVVGGSYGGFMVLSAITTYPELWGAAVEYFGISNFVTFLERTSVWRRPQREAEYGSLERDREFLESISPIHHLDRVRAPLLVVHGRNDPRVPFSEAEQIVAEIQRRGGVVDFLSFSNEGHGFARRENQLTSLVRTAEFLAAHLDRARPARRRTMPPGSRPTARARRPRPRPRGGTAKPRSATTRDRRDR